MQISAKTDYAVRALLTLAAAAPELVTIEMLVTQQALPRRFAESILSELRRAGLVRSRRGSGGGYALARPADEITIGAVIRVVGGHVADGPPPRAHGAPGGVADHLPDLWAAMRTSLRSVLDHTTLTHVLTGDLPEHVRRMVDAADAAAEITG